MITRTRGARAYPRPLILILAAVSVFQAIAVGNAEASPGAPMEVAPATFEPVVRPGTTAHAASPFDLAARGYEEEEYFVSGTARRYIFPDRMDDAVLVDGGHDYKTRIVVRRPTNASRFNGTVVLEWYNVTLGRDIDFNWAASHEHLMREGYAVVSLSAQNRGVENLKRWSPGRYGDLDVFAPDSEPGDPVRPNDVLSWDIFSQTAQALHTPGVVDALPGMDVEHVLATGESQAARRLTQYYNSIDPLHRVVDGMVFYDPGYGGTPLLRPDNPTKLISVGAETHSDGRPPVPDSEFTRRWEVAGTSHVSYWDMLYVDAMTSGEMDLRLDSEPVETVGELIRGCGYYPLWSAVPMHKVLNGAFHHVDGWMQGGPPAPTGQAMDRDETGAGLVHDENGRTSGGIELSEFVYPTAFNLGFLNPGPGFCRNGGHHRFYTEDELQELYPDRHEYVRNVTEITMANLEAGYILCFDAAETISEAHRVFGRGQRTNAWGIPCKRGASNSPANPAVPVGGDGPGPGKAPGRS